ncbi:type II toxin-antitoxin system RelE/ParE family toxin [Peteryoungia desertarenae]|uniref:type II toxin-antitoxin system RelE/ParE family toxin n=1 Tax=Peteryoungia desertarenae TaxID=1813451 RepID=UPI001FE85BD9|nr:type II toxin-antitoxin system RelE/ParE family toxin [Peteryoungia desertarenae]
MQIFGYIEADNPKAALQMDERIEEAAAQLLHFPESGRSGRVQGTRELVVSGTSYIIADQLDGDRLRILRGLHSSRLWPDDL